MGVPKSAYDKPIPDYIKKKFEEKGFYGTTLNELKRKITIKFDTDTVLMQQAKDSVLYDVKNLKKKIYRNEIESDWISYQIAEEKVTNEIIEDKKDRKSILGYDCHKVMIHTQEDLEGSVINETLELYITDDIKIPLHYNVIMDIDQIFPINGVILEAVYTVKNSPESKSFIKATKIDLL